MLSNLRLVLSVDVQPGDQPNVKHALGRWYRIPSEALRHYLHGRQLEPPIRLNPV